MTKVTNADLREDILGVKSDVVGLRGDFVDFKENDFHDLRTHVNHELEVITKVLDKKVTNDELLTSLGFSMLHNKFVRWSTGIIAAAVLSTVIVHQWVGTFWVTLFQEIAHGLTRL